MIKTIKKPSYLGTASQVSYKTALADAEGTYAQCHAVARRSVGAGIVGKRVALVRIAGAEHVVQPADIAGLPSNVTPHAFGIVEHCDGNGAIFFRGV